MIDRKRRGKVMAADLPEALETLTRRSLVKLDKVIKLPIDEKNAQQLRSIVTACGIAINAQLRADEARLRQKATGDALQRLLKIIEKERALLSDTREGAQQASVPVSTEDTDGTDLATVVVGSAVDGK